MELVLAKLLVLHLKLQADVVEDTALTDATKSFLAGRTSFSGTLEMNYDETDSPQQTLTARKFNRFCFVT